MASLEPSLSPQNDQPFPAAALNDTLGSLLGQPVRSQDIPTTKPGSQNLDTGRIIEELSKSPDLQKLAGILAGRPVPEPSHKAGSPQHLEFTPLPELNAQPERPDIRGNPDGSQIEVHDGRVSTITYADGHSRSFAYDDNGLPVTEVTPDGITWTRKPGADEWTSSQGQSRSGKLIVTAEGGAVFERLDGVRELHTTDGKDRLIQPDLASSDLKPLFQKNFSRLDKDGDGVVTFDEINAAVADKSFTGQDAQMVAALKASYKEIERLHDLSVKDVVLTSLLPETALLADRDHGISMNEMLKFDELQRKVRAESNRIASLECFRQSSFARVDADGNGFITKEEIEGALSDRRTTEADRQALELMRSRFDAIQSASNDEWGPERSGITRQDLDEYVKQFRQSKEAKLVADVDFTFSTARDKVQEANRELYADKVNPLASIKPEAVKQGRSGDCYLMSAVASLAKANPQAIRDMICDNHDGSFTVTFPGAPAEPVTIPAPTEQELALYGTGGQYGTWPAVLEKAYGQYRNDHKWFFQSKRSPSEGGDGGASLKEGLNMLTGKSADQSFVMLCSQSELDQKLQQAVRDGRPVTAGTARSVSGTLGIDDNTTADGLPRGHAYSIIGYDPQTEKVLVRNPWGHGEPRRADGTAKDGTDDGVFEMTLEEFKSNFTTIAYSG